MPLITAFSLLLAAPAGAQRPAIEYFPSSARLDGSVRPFSESVRVGDILYLSGQIGTRPDGKVPEDFEAQAKQTMENVAAALRARGLGWGDVFQCLVMLDDMADWPAFNKVYVTYFPAGKLPARSAFGADGLALGAKLELECKAYMPAR